ncbi:MAG: redoxin family protein [Alphaproteobacteria bacterium]|nr:redoxin family protein [Alphaproteobacteria bacterium]
MIAAWLALAWGSPDDVAVCLDELDVDCAERALVAMNAENSSNPEVLAALAHTRFYDGRYPEALDAMRKAVDAGHEDRWEELALYERTTYATANWVEERRGRFAVRFRPGLDAMLIDEAFGAIQGSDEHIAPLLGGSPPGVSRLELYPDGRSFIAASSLTRDDVETTGVVGLAKWSRLLITSPRALPRGYPWQDTIGHEYIHLMVAHHTADRAPVWLQEAIAKYLDARWRDGKDRFRLSVRQQGLLADALAKDDLVTFEEMHPSLAKLPTAERASLAYAQLATLMQYCFEQGGEEVLLRTLPAVREGTDPRIALADAAGAPSFDALLDGWRAWIAQQPLVGKKLAELPTVLDGGDDTDLDPLLHERQDLARFVTLGDLLREHGETEAAIVEYTKAIPADEPPSPLLSNRLAQSHIALGQTDRARRELEETLKDYPEFALSHKTLGLLLAEQGQPARARDELLEAAAISPFDPETRSALVAVERGLGHEEAARAQEKLLTIRSRGGDDVERKPIHTVTGDYELPRTEARVQAAVSESVGEDARPWAQVVGLDGQPMKLSDFRGKVLVLDFWATWCGPCKAVMPHLSELQNEHEGELAVVGLTSEARGKVTAFLAKTPVSYTIGIDQGGRTNTLYGVDSLPTVYVVGRDGRIVDVVVGAGGANVARLDAAVKKALEDE